LIRVGLNIPHDAIVSDVDVNLEDTPEEDSAQEDDLAVPEIVLGDSNDAEDAPVHVHEDL